MTRELTSMHHADLAVGRRAGAILLLALGACAGSIGEEGTSSPTQPDPPRPANPITQPPPATSPPAMTPGVPAGPAVDSTTLFACKEAAASPRRIWRLSGAQYRASVRALAPAWGSEALPNAFDGLESTERFTNYASAFGMPAPTFDRLMGTGPDLATRLLAALKTELPCVTAPDAACVRTTIETVGTRAFRRPIAADERDRYVAFVAGLQPALSPATALRYGLQAILQSPHFLFRTELGTSTRDASGRRKLTPYEAAAALSYTLTDAPPDAALMQAAASGALGSAQELRPHLLRLLGGDVAANPVVKRFFREYLRYEGTLDVFKEPKQFPYHTPDQLLADTDAFIAEIVKGKALLKTLLTADWGYAGPKTGLSYNLEGALVPKARTRVTFPAGQRAGVLTQPSFLSTFSESDHTDPIRRGKFIAQSLLCLGLPDTLPGQVPPLPELPTATMRERLSAHTTSAPGCKACHDIMDNLGLGLEAYDHTGRFRSVEHNKPIDARGAIIGTGTATDGPFNGAVELGAKLAASPTVDQCFIRHNFRYLFGRDETAQDACSLASAGDAWTSSGGDYVQLVAALLSSDSFLYRN